MELENIGKKIREYRNEKGWSQEELARRAEIPFTTLNKIESGVIKNPSIEKVAKIARALGVQIEKLLTG